MMILYFVALKSIILLFTITSSNHASAIHHRKRIPINLDIAKEIPYEIKVIMSEKTARGFYYYMKRSIITAYRIGDVLFDGKLLCPGNSMDFDRFVFSVTLPRRRKYIRIVSKTRLGNSSERKIVEFITEPFSLTFHEVVRKPVEIDILTQMDTEVINVDEEVSSRTVKFSVREDFEHQATIGVVRYGASVLNRKVRGLIYRSVVWKGGVINPHITIISKYNDGTTIETNYSFEDDDFVLHSKKLGQCYLKPWDEEPAGDESYDSEALRRKNGPGYSYDVDSMPQGTSKDHDGAAPSEVAINASKRTKPVRHLFKNTEYEWDVGNHDPSRAIYPMSGFYHDFEREAYKVQGLSFPEPDSD
ncbi:hypothetical protein BEWA_037130 [Theileria equi strain WA]|uniref:Signal peptide-containing protein n=1 Tax=Theileria equi strain WA TaxID=1537102 RepID=L1LE16_THEEQ|nr:hypothetical protein BEWA_037130 [Theileria equi strain WA]EKX73677.1 hypothetical protein BEWA_037130 [Theileria equi strain WA]|eukprot:XP_004833129.1 hypothetical protein BEWA_037130 [Theileria equi strain WA]